MKQILILFVLFFMIDAVFAQIDKDQLALAISKADADNTEKLKAFIWKRKSDVTIDGALKLTMISEFSFDEKGELQGQLISSESSVKKKPGIRGGIQKSAANDKAEYVQKALELSMAYTFMTKGQLMDFLSKAIVVETDGIIEAAATDVYMQGDRLVIWVDKKTNLYTKKKFKSLLDNDPIDGEINYEIFSNGVNHGSTTVLNLPAQKMKIDAVNQDYSQRVQ